MKNYRPISMLSIFSKIFEKLIHKEMTDYFDKHEYFNNSQYGFRKKRSTLHALLDATEGVYKTLDQKLHTLGIFIDFSRAFDTVNHTILLDKLTMYGIEGNFHKLISSYFTNRRQYVSYGGNDSELLSVTCGVPQGSVLGPLLFIIFINDLYNISKTASFVTFADDCNMFLSSKDRQDLYNTANYVLHNLHTNIVKQIDSLLTMINVVS